MKLYELNSSFNFGQYKDRKLREVATENAKYIEWCILNVEYFVVSESTANEIKKIYPRFLTSERAKEVRNKKFEKWKLQKVEGKRRVSNSRRSSDDAYSSNWDNEYYNDALDTDQQSPEWWDSL